jgi:hypothetical protein
MMVRKSKGAEIVRGSGELSQLALNATEKVIEVNELIGGNEETCTH